jgi:hypothetical protein
MMLVPYSFKYHQLVRGVSRGKISVSFLVYKGTQSDKMASVVRLIIDKLAACRYSEHLQSFALLFARHASGGRACPPAHVTKKLFRGFSSNLVYGTLH